MAFSFAPEAFSDPAARRFIDAVAAGNLDAALRLAAAVPGGVNTTGSNGETALLVATERMDAAMVRALIEAGANPNGAPASAPVALAVCTPDLVIAKILLSAGADPNGRMGDEPALYRAALVGAADGVNLLLDVGARVNELDGLESPPLFAAAAAEHWRVALRLLDRGASLVHVNRAGFTIGVYAHGSRLNSGAPDGQARDEIAARWRQAGLPWPPPNPPNMRKIMEEGGWPPPGTPP